MKMERVFREHDILLTTTIRDAKIMNLRIRDLVRVSVQCLEDDIEFLLAAQSTHATTPNGEEQTCQN